MTESKLPIGASTENVKTRIGVAKLTRLAFEGGDLGALWNDLLESTYDQPADTGVIMDLSVLAQILGDPQSGARLQDGALQVDRLYRMPPESGTPRLRLLALAGATDIGGNIPIGFLIGNSDVDLLTLYVVPGEPLPDPLPEHDVALVVLGNSDAMMATLDALKDITPRWPRAILNQPDRVLQLERDRFCALMQGAAHIELPKTARLSREVVRQIGHGDCRLSSVLSDGEFPLIIRPVNSHAGRGLTRLDDAAAVDHYLAEQPEAEFFISRFVDYSSPDGLYRKYRIVFIDGRPFACHMAIADDWKVWYLNANMDQDAGKRDEEGRFMETFDDGFATRHADAFDELTSRVGLDYFGIDCAETKDGRLLVFEAETALIVHDMDPPDVYPYKVGAMRKLFSAFVDMLYRRAEAGRVEAA